MLCGMVIKQVTCRDDMAVLKCVMDDGNGGFVTNTKRLLSIKIITEALLFIIEHQKF